MKKDFDNQENQSSATVALERVVMIGFWLSTVSSTVALSVAVYQLITSMIGTCADYWYAPQIAGIAITARFCYMVDFFGVYQSGKLFATEFFAWLAARKGVFASFAALRTVSMILWGILFTAFFALSFFTSWYGADLVKAFISPSMNSEKFAAISKERIAATKEVGKEQANKIKELETKRELAVANAGNSELRKLAKSAKNQWAVMKLDSFRRAAATTYDKQIAEERKDKAAVTDKFDKSYTLVEQARLEEAKAQLNGSLSQAGAIAVLTKSFGVFPLIISALGLIILAIAKVSQQAGISIAGKKVRATASSGFAGSGKRNNKQQNSGGQNNYNRPTGGGGGYSNFH
jgi:hypothetical protein